MAARLKLVELKSVEQTLFERICLVLEDGVPKTYAELSETLDCSYQQVYSTIRHTEELASKTPLMHRTFARSNRHYVFLKKHATKLGSLWNTDLINRPITFQVLLQLGGKK